MVLNSEAITTVGVAEAARPTVAVGEGVSVKVAVAEATGAVVGEVLRAFTRETVDVAVV